MMSGIKSRNTHPEIRIRRELHARGLRFRLHRKDLPGKPDLVLPRHRAVINVNGCFWHAHMCHLFKWPRTRENFWRKKIEGNRQRDARNLKLLARSGWRVLTVWECALKGRGSRPIDVLGDEIEGWLNGTETFGEVTGASF